MNFYEWAKIRMVHTDSSSAREHNSVNNFFLHYKQRQKKEKEISLHLILQFLL